jgi:2-methylcitrate dehydratase PrpD
MTDPEHGKSPPARVNPAALAVADAARLLAKAGGEPVTEAMIRADIEDGAPTNQDGTVNLVHYAAWLAMKTREDAGG